ncbi:hypothetical protein CEP81_07570 [Kocuria rhizophila]|nr:hypothetical protein CEP81_07570 [Kocuria rhizophila]
MTRLRHPAAAMLAPALVARVSPATTTYRRSVTAPSYGWVLDQSRARRTNTAPSNHPPTKVRTLFQRWFTAALQSSTAGRPDGRRVIRFG